MGKNRKTTVRKGAKAFDIDDPKLPKSVDEAALASGGFPYDKKLDGDKYEKELRTCRSSS